MLVASELLHIVLVLLLLRIRFGVGQSDLIATVIVLHFVEEVLAAANDVLSVTVAPSTRLFIAHTR